MNDSPPEGVLQTAVLGEGPLERVETPEGPPPPDPVELMAEANRLGLELRSLIVRCKKLPRTPGLEAHQDEVRALAIAQSNLQTGFLWLRRAIAPEKVF